MTNSLWAVDGQSVPCEPFQDQPLVETLLYYDGVMLSVSRLAGKPVLCCMSDVGEGVERWMQIEVSGETLASLKAGGMTLFAALSQGPMWVVDRDNADYCVNAWLISDLTNVPVGAKPNVDSFLLQAKSAE